MHIKIYVSIQPYFDNWIFIKICCFKGGSFAGFGRKYHALICYTEKIHMSIEGLRNINEVGNTIHVSKMET